MPSTPQVVATTILFDYLLNDAGVAIPNARVTVVLSSTKPATSISPATSIAQTQQYTTTDANGYWQFALIPNGNINPANTTYTVQTPDSSYDVTLGSVGPYQSTAFGTIVNVPVPLTAASSSIASLLVAAGEPGIDTATAGALLLGDNNATSIEMGAPTSVVGPLTVTEAAGGIVINAAGDVAARSFTAQSGSGPYTPSAVAGQVEAVAFQQWGNGLFFITSKQNPSGAADATGATDATASIQAALTAAGLVNGTVVIPPGTFSITAVATPILNVIHSTHVVGYGFGSILRVATGTGAGVDVIRIAPATATNPDAAMYLFEDFRITAQTGAPARHAFRFEPAVANAFIRAFNASRVWTDPFGGNSISVVNTGGFVAGAIFTCQLEDCTFGGGLDFTGAGDSVSLVGCTIASIGDSINAGQILVALVAGAAQFVMERCNFVGAGGVYIQRAIGARIRASNMQLSTPFLGSNAAFINLNGGTGGLVNCEVTGNVISVLAGGGAVDALRVATATGTWIDGNYLSGPGGNNCITITAAATQTFLGFANTFNGAATPISDSGTATIFYTPSSKFFNMPGTLKLNGAPGQIQMQGTGTAVIIGGTTGLSINNNANSANNLVLSDAGVLSIPQSDLDLGSVSASTARIVVLQDNPPTVGSGGAGVSALSVIAGSSNMALQVQATLTAIAPGVVIGVVAFDDGPLASAPKQVLISLSAPTAGVAAPPIVGTDTYSTSGFTIRGIGPTTVTTGTYIFTCVCIF